MLRDIRSYLIALLVAVPVAGCEFPFGLGAAGQPEVPPEEITELPRELSAAEVELLGAANRFGLELLHEIADERPGESHFISPLSASMALGMVMNGAAGTTWDEMRATLGFSDSLTEPEINDSYRGLIDLLGRLDPSVDFELANSFWYRETLTPRAQLLAAVEGPFGAQVHGVDFGESSTPAAMNRWARDHTRGLVENMVDDPLPAAEDRLLFLLNALYFQGNWTERFDPIETEEGDFHLPDGSTAPVRFMTQTDVVGYRHEPGMYSAVDKPYGGKAFSMTVVVPMEGVSVEELVTDFSDGGWDELVAHFEQGPSEVELFLPRFSLRWDGDLIDPLEAMGMESPFAPCEADLTRVFEVTPHCLYLDEVRQSSFVRVDEAGTEAAAVTIVGGVPVSRPPRVRADRPFVVAIRERLSGAILFAGVIVEPPVG